MARVTPKQITINKTIEVISVSESSRDNDTAAQIQTAVTCNKYASTTKGSPVLRVMKRNRTEEQQDSNPGETLPTNITKRIRRPAVKYSPSTVSFLNDEPIEISSADEVPKIPTEVGKKGTKPNQRNVKTKTTSKRTCKKHVHKRKTLEEIPTESCNLSLTEQINITSFSSNRLSTESRPVQDDVSVDENPKKLGAMRRGRKKAAVQPRRGRTRGADLEQVTEKQTVVNEATNTDITKAVLTRKTLISKEKPGNICVVVEQNLTAVEQSLQATDNDNVSSTVLHTNPGPLDGYSASDNGPSPKKLRTVLDGICLTESSPSSEQRVPVIKKTVQRKKNPVSKKNIASRKTTFNSSVREATSLVNEGKTNLSDVSNDINKAIEQSEQMVPEITTNASNLARPDTNVEPVVKIKKVGRPRKRQAKVDQIGVKPKQTKYLNKNPPTIVKLKLKPISDRTTASEPTTAAGINTNTQKAEDKPQSAESINKLKMKKQIKSTIRKKKSTTVPKIKPAMRRKEPVKQKRNILKLKKTLVNNTTQPANHVFMKQLHILTSPEKTSTGLKKINAVSKSTESISASSAGTLLTAELENDLMSISTSHSWANISSTTASSLVAINGQVPTVRLTRVKMDRHRSKLSSAQESTSGTNSSSSESSSTTETTSQTTTANDRYSDLVKNTSLNLSVSSTTTESNIYLSYLQQHACRLVELAKKIHRKPEEDEKSMKMEIRHKPNFACGGDVKISFGSGKRCVDINQNKANSVSSNKNEDSSANQKIAPQYVQKSSITQSSSQNFRPLREKNEQYLLPCTSSSDSIHNSHVFKSPAPVPDSVKSSKQEYSQKSSLHSSDSEIKFRCTDFSSSDNESSSPSTKILPVENNLTMHSKNSNLVSHTSTDYLKSIEKDDCDDDVVSLINHDDFSDSDEELKKTSENKLRRLRQKFQCEKKKADSTSSVEDNQIEIEKHAESTEQIPPLLDSAPCAVPKTTVNVPGLMYASPTYISQCFRKICTFHLQNKCKFNIDHGPYLHLPSEKHFALVKEHLKTARTRNLVADYVQMRQYMFGTQAYLKYAEIFMTSCIEKTHARFLVEILLDIYNFVGYNTELLEIGVVGLNRDEMRVKCDDLFTHQVRDGKKFLHILLNVSARSRFVTTTITQTLLTIAKQISEPVEINTAVLLVRKTADLLDAYQLENTYNLVINNTTEGIFGEQSLLEKYMYQMEQCSKLNSKLINYIEVIKCKIDNWKKNNRCTGSLAEKEEFRTEKGYQAPLEGTGKPNCQPEVKDTRETSFPTRPLPPGGSQWMAPQQHNPVRNVPEHQYRISPDTTQYPDQRINKGNMIQCNRPVIDNLYSSGGWGGRGRGRSPRGWGGPRPSYYGAPVQRALWPVHPWQNNQRY